MRYFILLFYIFFTTSTKAQFFFDFPPRQQVEQNRGKFHPPYYKGGDEGVKAYLQKNFKQPKNREKVDGRIVIAVNDKAKGNVEDTQVMRPLTRELDAKALRGSKQMKENLAT